MKANELRVGNYINYKSTEGSYCQGQIRTINHNGCNITAINNWGSQVTVKFANIESIAMTEEWLQKFGFRRNPEDMPFYFKDYRLFVNMGNHNIVHIMATKNEYAIPVQHGGYKIHQLQNLYFALTGTELTIK